MKKNLQMKYLVMKYPVFILLSVLCILPVSARSGEICPPEGYTREKLLVIKQGGFVIEDAGQRNALAVALLGCVSDPDSAIRDGVVFEGISTWLRGQDLSPESINVLFNGLVEQIRSTADPNGFQQPFAALILSEVVRTDRIDNTFSPAMRDEGVQVAATYLVGVRDYRGFSAAEGWRHGVAHGSDLVLQLVLDPNINAEQIQQLMAALATQVAPAGEIFYVYGEPVRLARAVFYAYGRGVVAQSFWLEWFEGISNPQPLESWAAAFTSQEGLAKRHNTQTFLLAVHFNATEATEEPDAALQQMILQAITRVSGG